MTKTNMDLSELLAKHDQGDFLRGIAEAVLQLIMESDVDGLIGAGRHERSGERTTWRNGYRERALDSPHDRAATQHDEKSKPLLQNSMAADRERSLSGRSRLLNGDFMPQDPLALPSNAFQCGTVNRAGFAGGSNS